MPERPRRGRTPASDSPSWSSRDVPDGEDTRAPEGLPELDALAEAEAKGILPDADRRALDDAARLGELGDVGDVGDIGAR